MNIGIDARPLIEKKSGMDISWSIRLKIYWSWIRKIYTI